MRILLIEDDEDVARLITAGMGEAGHQMTFAATGPEGMTQALAGGFDVMIFDRQLPGGIDSADLLKDLREPGNRHAGAVPVRSRRAEELDRGARCRR